jgi:hypothetical protein
MNLKSNFYAINFNFVITNLAYFNLYLYKDFLLFQIKLMLFFFLINYLLALKGLMKNVEYNYDHNLNKK